MTKNAYIHIPFCKTSKCYYCSFVSCPDLGLKDDYLVALKEQILVEYKHEVLKTLYFGGGTPSLLEISEVQELLDLFNFENDAEITFEVNPESVDFEYLSALRALGINRLSIGAQTFDDEILKMINRKHTSSQIIEAVQNAQKAGFGNISLDFIYGLPTQSLNGFVDDLKRAIELNIQHISLYGLKIEEGCYFYTHKPKDIADSDLQADMYLKAVKTLTNAGFEHYEISNFAKHAVGLASPTYKSEHNMNYWNNNSYYGFGCSASGYVDGTRYQMLSDLKKYIEVFLNHKFESRSGIPARQHEIGRDFEQKLEQEEILEEEIFLGFRKARGINISKINKKFGIDFNQKYAKILEKYSQFLRKTEVGYALTIHGMLISNEILAEFINC